MSATMLKWTLVLLFAGSMFHNILQVGEHREPSEPVPVAVAALLQVGFIIWILMVMP